MVRFSKLVSSVVIIFSSRKYIIFLKLLILNESMLYHFDVTGFPVENGGTHSLHVVIVSERW